MRSQRPVARDDPSVQGWPVVVSRHGPEDLTASARHPVTHSYAALLFHTGGRTRMEQDGAWNVVEGDVLLVPAGAAHRMIERRQARFWGAGFCVPCFAAEGAASLLAPFERVRDGASAVVRIPAARQDFLVSLFEELERVAGTPHGSPDDPLSAVQRSLLTLILNEVDSAASASPAPVATSRSVVIDSLRFIERNCLRRLTLADVAAAVGRSPAYVTTALTQATGQSAVQWIVSGRMAEARRLLLHSDEMVDVIAERVGYADATHFIRMFRRAHGATPAAWRIANTRAVPRLR